MFELECPNCGRIFAVDLQATRYAGVLSDDDKFICRYCNSEITVTMEYQEPSGENYGDPNPKRND